MSGRIAMPKLVRNVLAVLVGIGVGVAWLGIQIGTRMQGSRA